MVLGMRASTPGTLKSFDSVDEKHSPQKTTVSAIANNAGHCDAPGPYSALRSRSSATSAGARSSSILACFAQRARALVQELRAVHTLSAPITGAAETGELERRDHLASRRVNLSFKLCPCSNRNEGCDEYDTCRYLHKKGTAFYPR